MKPMNHVEGIVANMDDYRRVRPDLLPSHATSFRGPATRNGKRMVGKGMTYPRRLGPVVAANWRSQPSFRWGTGSRFQEKRCKHRFAATKARVWRGHDRERRCEQDQDQKKDGDRVRDQGWGSDHLHGMVRVPSVSYELMELNRFVGRSVISG